jgi:ABC-2 type transport system permease protein
MSVTTTTPTLDKSAFDTPGKGRGLLDIFNHRYLLKLLIGKSTSLRYRNSVMGWLWSYARPTVQFLLYYIVMGQLLGMHKNVEYFPIYLFSGLVVVNFFNEAIGNVTRSIVDNKALVRKIYLPRELFPVAALVSAFVNFLPQLAVLVVVCLFNGWVPTFENLGLFLGGMAIVMPFVLGLGLIFCAVNVRFRDAQNVVEIIRTIATWSSPVMYTWQMVYEHAHGWHAWIFDVYMSNPVTVAVELFHKAFWAPVVPKNDVKDLVQVAFPPLFGLYIVFGVIATILLLLLGQMVFRRFERTFAQDL